MRMRRAACLLLALLAAAGALPVRAGTFTVAGAADTIAVAPGATFTLDLVLRDASPPFNAFDLDVLFDHTKLTNLPMSPLSSQRGPLMASACLSNSPFHVFTTSPDSVVCTLVILCQNVSVTGPGVLYRLRFQAGAADAWTTIGFGSGTAFYMGGPRVDTLVRRPIVVRVGNPPVLGVGEVPEPGRLRIEAVAPNPARGTRPECTLRFRSPVTGECVVWMVDALGRRVSEERRAVVAGANTLTLRPGRLAPGSYRVVLSLPGQGPRSAAWVVTH